MAGCCNHNARFDGVSADYKRRLWLVIAINAAMFAVEMGAGQMSGSQALKADALDFLGDALTYGISLAVIGATLRTRALAALGKGVSLLLMGIWVFGSTVYQVFYVGVPQAEIMGVIGFMALAANLISVMLLARYKDGDANVRSVWLCSRNDAIGNVAVMIAALGVWGTATGWPDLVVAGIMAGLFLNSAFQILTQAVREWREEEAHAHAH
ncbi:cation transporter [Phaeobacter italicus]|jgi:cation diffusion facilitator family transporter|uniref:Zinc transporter ZitB n=2 Tax=Phaeobacter italicus TaxID=481446 RepID=A0A0H5DEL8_9RHOB|nr:cation transporter [Phaeobacter italicus]EEB69636.1 cation efflux protein [Ruegeria sp. R11]MEC8572198.1 cation transporter [Pseudomonadota bacterium]NKX70839.1 cation transporter [Rhodobacteraceae bacterium R_SAG1]MBO9443561.1 cation transporter [Phaeobacter italicus]MBY5977756.1 cation transporter [Phaeobacter italicus]